MAKYVCSGAKLKCSMGSQESDLGVIHPVKPVKVEGNPVAAMMDHKPFINIKPFGQCKSLANPIVAAATAAANGKLQKMPCIPNTTTPWMACKMNVMIKGQPALLDNSKLMCMWAGMIEIKKPGQKTMQEGGKAANSNSSKVADETKAQSAELLAANVPESEKEETEETSATQAEPAEDQETQFENDDIEEVKNITVKDFAEILKEIESKQGYEAARYYASHHIDYWKINCLAKRYVGQDGDEQNEGEEDNDPNLMPSRFMILFGADDDELEANGNLDDYPDGFESEDDDEDEDEHKMSVAKIREALIAFGNDNIEPQGPFDYDVYFAFMKSHLRRFSRIDFDQYFPQEAIDGNEQTEDLAKDHGIFTWKYFENHERDHDTVLEELNPELGDKLLTEKGANPAYYLPGICYRYPWVPFRVKIN